MGTRIAFLSYENIRSGLFKSQVLYPVVQLSKRRTDDTFIIGVFCRPSHLPDFKALRKELASLPNLEIRIVGPLLPLRYIGSVYYSVILLYALRLFIGLFIFFGKPSKIVARGYLSAFGSCGRKGLDLIFDPRSIWHLENASAGVIKAGSASFRYWSEVERKIVDDSRAIIVISDSMISYFKDISSSKSIHKVPILTHSTSHRYSESSAEAKSAEKLVCAYVGSLGLNGVNRDYLRDLLHTLTELGISKFLFLTDESIESVLSLFSNRGANLSVVVSPTDPKYISHRLQEADFGIHVLPKQLDSETRLGTKVLEYWNAGLPALVNDHVGSARSYIGKNSNLGLSVNDVADLTAADLMRISCLDRSSIRDFHKAEFSINVWNRVLGSLL